MPPYIHPEVERVRDDPEQGRTMRVVLAIEQGATSEVAERVIGLEGVTLEREFDTDMLLIESSETKIPQLCELEKVESISPNKQMRILS